MTARTFESARGPLHGALVVPGDKSVSHRAVLFAAMAEGTSHLTGVLDAADVRSTIDAVRTLGASVEVSLGGDGLNVAVVGWGALGPRGGVTVDCGNSGTTARLLMGVLAGWPEREFELTGDASLSTRPMLRVLEPLSAMGATWESPSGTLPVKVVGAALRGIDYTLPVASAQVKSAILLAGLRAEGETVVREPTPSRDHTERMLPAFGVAVGIEEAPRAVTVHGALVPHEAEIAVPGDPSSAAFLVGAALVVAGSTVALAGVDLNPTRIGFLRVLERMGADIRLRPVGVIGPEPVGDVVATFGALQGTTVAASEAPSLIDEVPLLAVVATQAFGSTRFEGVGELRVKESDRLTALVDALTALGAVVSSGEDWLEVEGPSRLHGAWLDALDDHRLAMAYSIAALVADTPVTIAGYDCIAVSYPRFGEALATLMVS